jgi:hypothetical protein
MISEILEEAGMDREKVRALRRQVLQGIVLLCQWQLQRMEETEKASARPSRRRKARRVSVE